jgi:hypothetical protein
MTQEKKMIKAFKKFGALADFQLEILLKKSGNNIRPLRGLLQRKGIVFKAMNTIMNKKGTKHSVYQYVSVKNK